MLDGVARFNGGHAIKLIGWDSDEKTGQNYWIAENSWGESWGINGFVHIATGQQLLYMEEFVLSPNPLIPKEAEERVFDEEKPETTNL